MNKSLLILTVLLYNYVNAQVGIGNTEPKATLHVTSQNVNSSSDAIIPPSLSKLELAKKLANTYNSNHEGAFIYVNDVTTEPVATEPSFAQVANIDAVGAYYFDGSLWQKYLKEPWLEFNTNKQASTNSQHIYQMGNVGIGVSKNYNNKLTVKGNSSFNGDFNASNYDFNYGYAYGIYTTPALTKFTQQGGIIGSYINPSAPAGELSGINISRIQEEAGIEIMSFQDIGNMYQNEQGGATTRIYASSKKTGLNDIGSYDIITNPNRNLGYGIHNFSAYNGITKKTSIISMDTDGLAIGKISNDLYPGGIGNIDTFESLIIQPNIRSDRSFYILPLEPPTAGQVLTFDSVTTEADVLTDTFYQDPSTVATVTKTKTKWSTMPPAGLPEPVIVSNPTSDAIIDHVINYVGSSVNADIELYTTTLNLDRKALVIFNYNISTDFKTSSGGVLTDERIRAAKVDLVVNGVIATSATTTLNSYNPGSTAGIITGPFMTTGSTSMVLGIGTHSVSIKGNVVHNTATANASNACKLTFGSSPDDRISINILPL